jgi:hypothetical protein
VKASYDHIICRRSVGRAQAHPCGPIETRALGTIDCFDGYPGRVLASSRSRGTESTRPTSRHGPELVQEGVMGAGPFKFVSTYVARTGWPEPRLWDKGSPISTAPRHLHHQLIGPGGGHPRRRAMISSAAHPGRPHSSHGASSKITVQEARGTIDQGDAQQQKALRRQRGAGPRSRSTAGGSKGSSHASRSSRGGGIRCPAQWATPPAELEAGRLRP